MTGRDDPIGKVCVGVIAGAFGIRGEVRLKSFCAEPEAIADYAPLTDAAGREYSLVIDRPVKGGFAARLGGVPTREAAEALKGVRLFVPRHRLPSLPSDEFYHADLIGLPVADGGGRRLGQVRAVHDFGAGDMLEIAGPGLSQPVMLPFTLDTVPIVDLAAHRIVADPPAGLFPDDGSEDDAPAEGAGTDAGAEAGDGTAARKDEA